MAAVDSGVRDAAARQRGLTHSLRAVTGVAILAAVGLALGYARDAALAGVFGASSSTDAFFTATLIPTIVATVVMSGALAPALLPVFTGALHEPARAWELANALISLAAVLLALLCASVIVCAPLLVSWLAPGFNLQTHNLAVELTMLGAPLLALLGLSALLGAMANALGLFRVPALSPVLVNGTAFLFILALGLRAGIQFAVLGLLVGALIQLVLQGLNLRRAGWHYKPSLRWRDPRILRVLALFAPLALFLGLAQVVPIVERMVSSGFPTGDFSLVVYAGKLYQIPGVVLASSLAIVLYPQLAHHQAQAQHAEFALAASAGVRAAVFLTLPLAIWFLWSAEPLVHLVFERGAFSARDTAETARLLQLYSLAIIPAGIALVMLRAIYARQQMKFALGIGGLNLLVYLAAVWLGTRAWGLAGLPIAFFVSQVFAALVSAPVVFGRSSVRSLFQRDVAALAGAALALILAFQLTAAPLASLLANAGGLTYALVLCLTLTVTAALYLALTSWWRVPEAREYLGLFLPRIKFR